MAAEMGNVRDNQQEKPGERGVGKMSGETGS